MDGFLKNKDNEQLLKIYTALNNSQSLLDREFNKQTTTATSLNNSFNEQYNSSARAFNAWYIS